LEGGKEVDRNLSNNQKGRAKSSPTYAFNKKGGRKGGFSEGNAGREFLKDNKEGSPNHLKMGATFEGAIPIALKKGPRVVIDNRPWEGEKRLDATLRKEDVATSSLGGAGKRGKLSMRRRTEKKRGRLRVPSGNFVEEGSREAVVAWGGRHRPESEEKEGKSWISLRKVAFFRIEHPRSKGRGGRERDAARRKKKKKRTRSHFLKEEKRPRAVRDSIVGQSEKKGPRCSRKGGGKSLASRGRRKKKKMSISLTQKKKRVEVSLAAGKGDRTRPFRKTPMVRYNEGGRRHYFSQGGPMPSCTPHIFEKKGRSPETCSGEGKRGRQHYPTS